MGRVPGTDPWVGLEIAGYRIVSVLGRGATSTVYRAVELRLEREIALKLLSAALSEDRRFRRRFLRESKLAASLEHPNVIPIFAAGEVDGQLYIAMRLVDSDLRSVLREHGRLPKQRALAVCGQVADALDAAHARGLVHRDVKPSNVLLARDPGGEERVFLADFGLTVAGGSGSVTEEGLGTIDYMAPEQIRGEQIDGRADLYSLACVLYECLVGEPPFLRGSAIATLYAHLRDEPPAASERLRLAPRTVDRAFARALAKEPHTRFRTGVELVREFGSALGLPRERSTRPSGQRSRRMVVVSVVVAGAATAALLGFDSGGARRAEAHGRVVLPGYRLTASERLTSGAPDAHPTIGLVILIDDGRGPVERLSSITTGQLTWRFDARQVSFGSMLHAPRGETLGYFTSNATPGGQFVQQAVVKTGVSTSASGEVLNALLIVPREFARVVGAGIPVVVRTDGRQVAATLNLQSVVRRFRAIGAAFSFSYSALYLLGGMHRGFGGASEPIVTNPSEPVVLRAAASARLCADRDCTSLGPEARDSIAVSLPQALTVEPPSRVLRGRPSLFRGTGVPGEHVTVVRAVRPGSAPMCTSENFALRACAPPIATAFEGDSHATTIVRKDGNWSIALPLPTASAPDPRFGKSGRYAVAESSDLVGDLLVGGASTVLAEATHNTVVALAKPKLRVERGGRRGTVAITVPGDKSGRYRLSWRGRVIASGWLDASGAAKVVLPDHGRPGRLEATVFAPGVAPATGGVDYRPGGGGT
jgi:serine/threonine protein kinase